MQGNGTLRICFGRVLKPMVDFCVGCCKETKTTTRDDLVRECAGRRRGRAAGSTSADDGSLLAGICDSTVSSRSPCLIAFIHRLVHALTWRRSLYISPHGACAPGWRTLLRIRRLVARYQRGTYGLLDLRSHPRSGSARGL
jgi:hypothetical protein